MAFFFLVAFSFIPANTPSVNCSKNKNTSADFEYMTIKVLEG